MKKLLFLPLTFFLLAPFLLTPLLAQDQLETTTVDDSRKTGVVQDDSVDKRERGTANKAQQRTAEQLEFRCSITSSKIDSMLNRYQNNKTKHEQVYLRVSDRIMEVLTTLEAEGYDVEKAQAAVEQFVEMINSADTDLTTFIALLEEARDMVCEEDYDSFKQKLEEARTELQRIKNNMQEINQFFHNELKPLLLEIREQLSEVRDQGETTPSRTETTEPTTNDNVDPDTEVSNER